ncbi:hypothetical protein SDRG_16260 [Saprolegnia diclina VS20]|uniref:RING-type domain-containing protein n=1 Tax=Saprolegnia diclina (strain VS20) TaxID=1156394 RepID=T0R1L0_SAPDV|nr:hypothetical protein SDRG_16260 [Saprolegnia diclina VS20]EQC25888.1 hypothetical protein SDRG_16260 [Saprolegnia diclina VS20]|eukprot:XP_008620684.1 hypothetical protein SDRG_16260 [Saprolegnia diclina VS20]
MMALASEDVTCAVCLEPFASPVSLYCGHSFDRECLLELVGSPCPICRQSLVLANVALQPKNSLIQQAVRAFFSSNAMGRVLVEAREADHEERRVARLAAPKPVVRSTSSGRRSPTPDVSVSWGSVVFFQALSFPWDAVFGPAGLDDEDETPESCALSWSVVFMFVCCFLLSQMMTYILDI